MLRRQCLPLHAGFWGRSASQRYACRQEYTRRAVHNPHVPVRQVSRQWLLASRAGSISRRIRRCRLLRFPFRKPNGWVRNLSGENVHFTVPAEGLRNLVYTPHIYVVDLIIDGKKVNAILKDIQFHPVKDTILHVDFYQIDETKPIVMEVPVQMEGLAEGVKAGGKLTLQMRKLKVKALYNAIPEKLIVNVSHLGLGKTVKVGELSYEGLELLNAKEAVACAVKLTRAARGAAAAAANN